MNFQQHGSGGPYGSASEPVDLPTPQSIGSNVRDMRRKHRLTLSDIAEAVGITVSALSRIENGHNTPSLQTLVRICDVIGIGIAEVFRRPAVWAGPTISRLAPEPPSTGLVLLSRAEELRVGVFQGDLVPGSGGTLKSPTNGGIVAVTAKEGVSIIRQGGAEYAVHPGDALTIRAEGQVRWINGGRGPASALWIYTPAPTASGSPFRADPTTRY